MIHDGGFLAWHQHFVAELETWLVNNGGSQFVPVPYWDPSRPIPAQLDKNNNSVNMPLPQNLRPAALKKISSYTVLDHRIVPYHGSVHDALGGQMPNPDTSPSDPIFWPFHAFLVSVYERWRNSSTSERNTSSICAGVNRLRRSIHHIRTAKKAAVR